MKKTLHPILLALLFCAANPLYSQTNFDVLLNTGTTTFPENVREYVETATIGLDEMIDGKYYRLLQFHKIPDQAKHDELAQAGIELLEYIPHMTYVAAIPTTFQASKFEDLGVRSIQHISQDMKMSSEVKYRSVPKWSASGDNLLAMLKFHKNLKYEDVLAYLDTDGVNVIYGNGINNFLRTSFPVERIDEVAALPYVAYLELVPAPDVPDDILGRSLHRANVIDTEYPSGRHYDGEGITVLCRDDGLVGPHIDFTGRMENLTTDATGTHGDGVSGIMAGAGNLNPRYRGMAAGAWLKVINYQADFLDNTMQLHFDEGVLVTNSSYSNGCNAGYTEITETVDQQIFENQTLLHVFSAGNSNNNACGYGAGDQWGNITGGHKQGKNVIATANLNSDATLRNSSSRGPAADGRIKPDIAAHGAEQISTDPDNEYQSFGGTSAASPGIAGITAMLHQAYAELNGGETAKSPLLKGILLNTANDLGNKGPDFKFGWGHVNAYRAALTLEENRYSLETIEQDTINTHTITIPDGVLQARMMVYWPDQPGTVFAAKALVNNIDMWVTDATGAESNPWLLDHTPNPDALNTPATTGVDDLNNVEQVAIDNPIAGEYTINVQGAEIPFGAHEYYLIWEFRMDDVTLTHPVGGEAFDPGEVVRIHWDMQGTDQEIALSYSTDGGMNWNPVADVAGDIRMYDWTVPNEISGNVLFQVERANGVSDVSDAPFSIAPRPENVHATEACLDYIRIAWDPVDLSSASATTEYEVFVLGDKFMESVGTTTDLFFDIPTTDPANDHWFAVASIGENGLRSERTIATLYNEGLMNCALQLDLAIQSVDSPGQGTAYICGGDAPHVVVTLHNSGLTDLTDVLVSYQLGVDPIVTEAIPGTIASGEMVTYEFMEELAIGGQGSYEIEIFTTVNGDMYEPNNILSYEFESFYYNDSGEALDYAEDFQNASFPPEFYFVGNPDGQIGWEQFIVTGTNGNQTLCAGVDNYVYSTQGEEDAFIVVPIDLTNAVTPSLSFDVAYASYSETLFDGLRIEIAECGGAFDNVVYEKFDQDLATAGYQGSVFSPSSPDDWRHEVIDLTDFVGNTIVIKFVNINGYGNTLLVDNINVFQPLAPNANFEVSSVSICQGETITFTNLSDGSTPSYEWDFGSGADPGSSNDEGPIDVTFDDAGLFTVSLTVSNDQGSSTFTQEIDVAPQPIADFSATVDQSTVTFTNNSEFATSYFWNFGDGEGGISPNPVYTYDENGTYTVTLTATNDCGSEETSIDVTIMVSSVNELAGRLGAALTPNPTSGVFNLTIENDRSEALTVEVLDVRGVRHSMRDIQSTVGTSNLEFDLAHLPSGMYLVKIVGHDGYKALRLVVE